MHDTIEMSSIRETLRCHLLWLVLALVALVASAAVAATPIAQSAVSIENDVLRFSYELENWLDVSKPPCQDFYGYVCGRSMNTTQAQLEKRLEQQQKRFEQFLAEDNNDQLLDVELKLKHFYNSCKEARSLDELRSSHMYRTSGGWPAIDDSENMIRKRQNMTWMAVLGVLHEAGVEYFFKQRVEIKSNKREVHIWPDESTRYTLRKFEQLTSDVMQEYGVEAGRARLVALETMSFERSRREVIEAEQKGGDNGAGFTYERFKLKMSNGTTRHDWDTYFKKLLGKAPRNNDMVIVQDMEKLAKMFQLLETTTMSRLLNWIWIEYLMDKSTKDCQRLVQNYFEPVYQHIVERTAVDAVQMAQMYADLGRAYDEVLATTPWIDEMSQQNSKQFLGRIIHLTLNGDASLDADYAALTVTPRNFYRNLEKVQRFLARQSESQGHSTRVLNNAVEVTQAAAEFMKVFLTLNTLLQQNNLTTPLNYILVGERFAEHMIAGGSSSPTPGAWRSMDSEREFEVFKQCMRAQQSTTSAASYNLNDMIQRMLAQYQTLHAFAQWQRKDAALIRRLDNLLAAGRLQLSLRKLYYVGALLSVCRQSGGESEQREFVHSYLRNSQQFSEAFGCQAGEELHAQRVCKVL